MEKAKQPFWEARERRGKGRPRIFETSDDLWQAATKYFAWVEDNPLQEEKVFHYQGEITRTTVAKMRAMTLDGLCFFLSISRQTWYDYAARQDFVDVTREIDHVIRQQKFAGAAADMLNANIIARDLGLVDSAKVSHTGENGGAVEVVTLSASEYKKARAEMLNEDDC